MNVGPLAIGFLVTIRTLGLAVRDQNARSWNGRLRPGPLFPFVKEVCHEAHGSS